MQGAYGGLIVIIMYAAAEAVVHELFLITNTGSPILTNLGQEILVTEEV